MAVVQSDGKIIVKKKDRKDLSIYHFDSVDDLVNKINQYDTQTKTYGFVPSNCDLSGINFSGKEFISQEIDSDTGDYAVYDFSGSDLSDCNFNNCKNVWATKLENTVLNNTQMQDCDFESTSLSGSKGKNTNFKNANFNNAELEGCAFEEANFEDAYFYHASLNDSQFINSNLKVHDNSGRSGLRRCDVSGSEIDDSLRNFYAPKLKMDNLRGSIENIEKLRERVNEVTKEYEETQQELDADRSTPQYSAKFNISGLKTGRF